MKKKDCKNLLLFVHKLENLKNELRHSWTSKDRQESVAEHSWRTSFMILLLIPNLKYKINIKKALMMAIIHDLGEVNIGDEHYLNDNKARKKQ